MVSPLTEFVSYWCMCYCVYMYIDILSRAQENFAR